MRSALWLETVLGGIATERVINRWIIITGLFAVTFAVLARLFPGESLGSEKTDDITFPLCEYISVDLLKTDVELIPYDGDRIRLVYRSDTPLTADLGDNVLSVAESDEFVISLFTQKNAERYVKLYLPQEYYRDIHIYTVSGNVTLGAVDSDKITVVTNSGNIASDNTRSLSSLTTSGGDIRLGFYRVIPGTSIFSRTGNAEISFPKGSSVAVNFETDTGFLSTDFISGKLSGSYLYSFNGGGNIINASLENGVLTVCEQQYDFP